MARRLARARRIASASLNALLRFAISSGCPWARPQSIETSGLHLDVIRDLKRIDSHLTAVAYPILDAAGELRPSRLRRKPKAERAARRPIEGRGRGGGRLAGRRKRRAALRALISKVWAAG